MICFNLKIPKNFIFLIHQDGSWFLHVSFVCMVKFEFLEQFPVDHFPHSVVSSLKLFLRRFATFASYLFNVCVFVTTYLALAILLCIIDLHLNIIGPYAVFCAAKRRGSVSLLKLPFLSHLHVLSCVISSVYRKKYPISRFSSHFCFFVFLVFLILVLSVLLLAAIVFHCSF